jgi:hypothetical protein
LINKKIKVDPEELDEFKELFPEMDLNSFFTVKDETKTDPCYSPSDDYFMDSYKVITFTDDKGHEAISNARRFDLAYPIDLSDVNKFLTDTTQSLKKLI